MMRFWTSPPVAPDEGGSQLLWQLVSSSSVTAQNSAEVPQKPKRLQQTLSGHFLPTGEAKRPQLENPGVCCQLIGHVVSGAEKKTENFGKRMVYCMVWILCGGRCSVEEECSGKNGLGLRRERGSSKAFEA